MHGLLLIRLYESYGITLSFTTGTETAGSNKPNLNTPWHSKHFF